MTLDRRLAPLRLANPPERSPDPGGEDADAPDRLPMGSGLTGLLAAAALSWALLLAAAFEVIAWLN